MKYIIQGSFSFEGDKAFDYARELAEWFARKEDCHLTKFRTVITKVDRFTGEQKNGTR